MRDPISVRIVVCGTLRKGQLSLFDAPQPAAPLFDTPVTVHSHQRVTVTGQPVEVQQYQSRRKKKAEQEEEEKRPLVAEKPPAPAAAAQPETTPEPSAADPEWKVSSSLTQESPHEPERVKKLVPAFRAAIAGGTMPTDPRAVRDMAAQHAGGNPAEWSDDLYDSVEGALARHSSDSAKSAATDSIKDRLERAHSLEEQLPRRSRTLGLSDLQQFSTPLTIAEAVQIAAAPRSGETVLEPTAGTGNLIATLAAHHDGKIVANELEPRRVNVLKNSDWGDNVKVEQGNYLTRKGKADVIVTNPPWGSYRTGKYGQPIGLEFTPGDVAERFVAKSMRDLNDGGRLVAVMPTTMLGSGGSTFRRWLDQNHTIRAQIEMPGDWYSRRGTQIASVLLVVDKGKHGDQPAPITKTLSSDERGRRIGTYPLDELADMLAPLAEGGTHGRTAVVQGTGWKASEPSEESRAATIGMTPEEYRRAGPARQEKKDARTQAAAEGAGTGGPSKEPEPAGAGSSAGPERDEASGDGGPGPGVQPAEPSVDAGVVAEIRERAAADPSPEGGLVPGPTPAEYRATIDRNRASEAAQAAHSPIFTEFVRPYEYARGTPHPRLPTESRNLAAVDYPPLTYKPSEPVLEANRLGRLSNESLIAVAAARQANENGHGFLMADATGLGKSAAIGAYVLDLIHQKNADGTPKHRRILVMTKSKPNAQDLQEHFRAVASGQKLTSEGGSFPARFIYIPDYKKATNQQWTKDADHWEALPTPDDGEQAVYFCDYATDISRFEKAFTHLDPDALAADEAHECKNLDAKRGTLWGSLHKSLIAKNAPILYATATPATSVSEMEYLFGLKEWSLDGFGRYLRRVTGHGGGEEEKPAGPVAAEESEEHGETESIVQAKEKKKKFRSEGKEDVFRPLMTPAETEQVIREMKMKGKLMARDLWREMDFEAREERLGPEEVEEFDRVANFLRKVRQTHAQFVKANKADRMRDPTAHLQFATKRLLAHYRIQRAIKVAKESLARGEQPVISLAYVNEVEPDEGNVLAAIQTINTRQREPRVDSEGHSVAGEYAVDQEIPEAVMAQAQLVEEARETIPHIPDPIELIEKEFGANNVASITGRTGASERKQLRERFQNGSAKVAVISGAGKTGISLHDKNGVRRHLIVSDYEWSAPKTIQEFGRVDRTGQKSSPKITFLHQGAASEKKFIATIAARLKSLGATSKGQAESTQTDALDDFEFGTPLDVQAMRETWRHLPEDARELFIMHRAFRDPAAPDKPVHETAAGIKEFLRELQWMPLAKGEEIFSAFLGTRDKLLSEGDPDALLSRTQATNAKVLRTTKLREDAAAPLEMHEYETTETNPDNWFSRDKLPEEAKAAVDSLPYEIPDGVWHRDDVHDWLMAGGARGAEAARRAESMRSNITLREADLNKIPEPEILKWRAQGNTYPVKDSLRAAGGRWNAVAKVWEFTKEPTLNLRGVNFHPVHDSPHDAWRADQLRREIDTFKRQEESATKEADAAPSVDQLVSKRHDKPTEKKLRRAILTGMITPEMVKLANYLPRRDSGAPVRSYRRIKDPGTGKEYVGLEIPPSGVRGVKDLYDKATADDERTPDSVLTDLRAGDKVQLSESGWSLRMRKDGTVTIDGAKMAHKETLLRHGARFNAVGYYWSIPEDRVPGFVQEFGLSKSMTRVVIRNRVAPSATGKEKEACLDHTDCRTGTRRTRAHPVPSCVFIRSRSTRTTRSPLSAPNRTSPSPA